jgi:hypothetical protein
MAREKIKMEATRNEEAGRYFYYIIWISFASNNAQDKLQGQRCSVQDEV